MAIFRISCRARELPGTAESRLFMLPGTVEANLAAG